MKSAFEDQGLRISTAEVDFRALADLHMCARINGKKSCIDLWTLALRSGKDRICGKIMDDPTIYS